MGSPAALPPRCRGARPETVLADIARAMRLAEYQSVLPSEHPTLLKINISWQHYYPACSTTPWQLEGVIRTLRADGLPEEPRRIAGALAAQLAPLTGDMLTMADIAAAETRLLALSDAIGQRYFLQLRKTQSADILA